MRHIFHYPFSVEQGWFEIALPEKARFLQVGKRCGRAVAWFLVDPALHPQKRRFYAAYTGLNRTDLAPKRYLGTVCVDDWQIVIHYFEEDK